MRQLSANFLALAADDVDGFVDAGMESVCELFRFDRSSLAQWDAAANRFVITHVWARQGLLRPLGFTTGALPWLSDQLRRGETIHFRRLSDLPDEASIDRESLRRFGVISNCILPLRAGVEDVFGALSFASASMEIDWPKTLLERLRLFADLFANALLRKRTTSALVLSTELEREAKEREAAERRLADEQFRLVIEAIPAAVIVTDNQGRILQSNSHAYQAFKYGAEELFGRHIEELMPARFREKHSGHHAQFVASPSARPMGAGRELYGLRKDGNEFPVEIGLNPIGSPENPRVLCVITDITERKQNEGKLLAACEHISKLKDQLEQENTYLRSKFEPSQGEVVGQSQAITEALSKAKQVAETDSTVLILGETGTGKELIARFIHENSGRKNRRMVKVNCAALPAALVESELFGRERGAYTGALTREIGRFELANGSTIFLDEVGELPLELQAKLLRVLQEGEFERLGNPRTIRVDVRVIAATARDLQADVKEGKFRSDLFYRLNVFPIDVPPLRERREDIPALVWHFLREIGNRMGRRIETVRASTMKDFQGYSWPGNIRELRNLVERYLITNKSDTFEAQVPKDDSNAGSPMRQSTAREAEEQHLRKVLETTGWRIRGAAGAAELLGMKPTTLESRLKKYGILRRTATRT